MNVLMTFLKRELLTCLAIKKKFSMFMFVLYLVLFLLIIELGLETTKQLRLRFRHLLTWNNGCKIQIIGPRKKKGASSHFHT